MGELACLLQFGDPYSCLRRKLSRAEGHCAGEPQELECLLIQLPNGCLDMSGCVRQSLVEASDKQLNPTETLVGWLLALAVTALVVYRDVPRVSINEAD